MVSTHQGTNLPGWLEACTIARVPASILQAALILLPCGTQVVTTLAKQIDAARQKLESSPDGGAESVRALSAKLSQQDFPSQLVKVTKDLHGVVAKLGKVSQQLHTLVLLNSNIVERDGITSAARRRAVYRHKPLDSRHSSCC